MLQRDYRLCFRRMGALRTLLFTDTLPGLKRGVAFSLPKAFSLPGLKRGVA